MKKKIITALPVLLGILIMAILIAISTGYEDAVISDFSESVNDVTDGRTVTTSLYNHPVCGKVFYIK